MQPEEERAVPGLHVEAIEKSWLWSAKTSLWKNAVGQQVLVYFGEVGVYKERTAPPEEQEFERGPKDCKCLACFIFFNPFEEQICCMPGLIQTLLLSE